MYKQNAHPRMQNKAKNVNKCKCKMKKIASAQAQGEQMWKGYSEQKYKHINACWPTQVKIKRSVHEKENEKVKLKNMKKVKVKNMKE